MFRTMYERDPVGTGIFLISVICFVFMVCLTIVLSVQPDGKPSSQNRTEGHRKRSNQTINNPGYSTQPVEDRERPVSKSTKVPGPK